MARVSIGQVENLSHAVAAIQVCAEEAETESSLRVTEIGQKLAGVETFLNESAQLTQEQEAALAEAEAIVFEAEAAVAEAQAALYDDDEDDSSAEDDLAEAEAALAEAEMNREKAARNLDLAHQREEIARGNYIIAQNLYERVRLECSARLNTIKLMGGEGTVRLGHAQEALEAYLNSNPDAKAVYGLLNWHPPANTPVMPQTIHDNLNLGSAQQRILVQYLAETDPVFRAKIVGYREALASAQGQAERDAVYLQMSKNLSGEYAEKMAAYALSPLGENVQVHVVYELKDGRKTFTDILILNLKEPVILGKGEGMMAPKGGSIAIEVKTGHKKYLKSQKEHMEYQARAHTSADASMVLCSRDIKNLSPEDEAELRTALKTANSPILAMLPEKDDIDEALWKNILEVSK